MRATTVMAAVVVSLQLSGFVCSCAAQARSVPSYRPGEEYDARRFLSPTELVSFKRAYPDFDEPKVEKKWEWRDVDPLGLFSPAENRERRRKLFLCEYSGSEIDPSDGEPSEAQMAFKTVLESQFENATLFLGHSTIKVSTPYTEEYDRRLPTRGLLEKTAKLGLQWAQVGGVDLYIYNGPILMSWYKAGYVSLADLNIDRPPTRVTKK
jgi:hypothetical protein